MSFSPRNVRRANRAIFHDDIFSSQHCDTERSSSRLPGLFGEANLPRLQSGIPEGGNDDELVAVPLRGLAELDVERFACRGDHLAVGPDHLPAEGPGGAGDHGDPVAAAELNGVRGVHVYVGEHAYQLPHRRGVRFPSVDRLGVAGDVRDHVGMVDCVHRCEVAGVEGVVALLHEREQVCGPAGVGGRGVHNGSLSDRFFALALSEDIRLMIRFSLLGHRFKASLEFLNMRLHHLLMLTGCANALPLQLKWLHRAVQRSRVSYVLSSFLVRSLLSFYTWDWSFCLFRQATTRRAIGGWRAARQNDVDLLLVARTIDHHCVLWSHPCYSERNAWFTSTQQVLTIFPVCTSTQFFVLYLQKGNY